MSPTEELGEEIVTLSAHFDAAAHRLLECIRRFDEEGGWADQGALSCAHWLAWRVGLDPATAREKVRVARALGKLPAMDEALRTARLSYAKVRALTRVATAQNESGLLEMALVATAAQIGRICRYCRAALEGERALGPAERSVQKRVLPGGMVKLELVLRAIECAREVPAHGAQPSGEAAAASAEARPTRADGAVRVAESYLAGHPAKGTGGERFQVMVHLGQEALGGDGEWAATLEDGTAVSGETLRRVACDCALVAVSEGGETPNIGRRSRSIPPALRRALMARDRGCVFPGCTHTRYLHDHHIEYWLHGGETSLENTVLACSRHHHMLHEGGWKISRGADGQFLFDPPGCKPLARNPQPEPVEDAVGWMREWADERGLELGPEVNMPNCHMAARSLLEATWRKGHAAPGARAPDRRRS